MFKPALLLLLVLTFTSLFVSSIEERQSIILSGENAGALVDAYLRCLKTMNHCYSEMKAIGELIAEGRIHTHEFVNRVCSYNCSATSAEDRELLSELPSSLVDNAKGCIDVIDSMLLDTNKLCVFTWKDLLSG